MLIAISESRRPRRNSVRYPVNAGLPHKEERREIVAALDAVSKKIEVAQEKNRLLNELFRTLLHQLMTAQIRVHDLDLSELEISAAA
jgi:type I restriction enzyme S subunit